MTQKMNMSKNTEKNWLSPKYSHFLMKTKKIYSFLCVQLFGVICDILNYKFYVYFLSNINLIEKNKFFYGHRKLCWLQLKK